MEENQQQIRSRRSYIYDSKGGKSRKKLFAIIGGIVIVILILIVGITIFSNNSEPEDEDIFATPAESQPTSTQSPTPTTPSEDTSDSSSDVDKSEYSILVQNGSGTAGAAGRLTDILGDLGYTIFDTENADNFDYVETVIRVTSGNKTLLNLLKNDLKDDYTIGETSTDYEGSASAVIIIGAE